MIQLYPFQQKAADSVAEKFLEYVEDPVVVGTAKQPTTIPFFQALASITASGKTVMLADAVSTIATALAVPPVILWLSKGKVVVEQSFANLMAGGKYHHLLGRADVAALADYDPIEVEETDRASVFFATVGTFNQRDKEDGSLRIYRSEIDTAEESTWDALNARRGRDGTRRPLLIVYDEAHNLSDQQTELLMELEPDGFLLASATMRLPRVLAEQVNELRRRGKTDDWLITQVDAKAVADSGLVKSTLLLAGYRAPMEETVSALLSDMAEATADATAHDVKGSPKAIYVCQTNIVEGNAYVRDDPKQPFLQRQAPPILIWRYLTENCGVDPASIATYASLAFHRDYPPPATFVHYKGGDRDYADFADGDYRHIIFNLSLQEGWDDPLCYFAYVDKSMESRVQVEQVIGRVLRQPEAKRFEAARLNTAHFYVRVDRNEVFTELIGQVARKLSTDAPEIRIVTAPPGKARPVATAVKGDYEIPATAYDAGRARDPIARILRTLTDYRGDDGTNVQAIGERGTIRQVIGETGSGSIAWQDFESSNRVSARWVFQREVRRRYQGALQVADVSLGKFDAQIGIGSNAYAHIAQVAGQVVDAYLENVVLVQKRRDSYRVGDVFVRADDVVRFENAIHAGYDGLNALERSFADALDATGFPWFRNPSRSGYGIPLISPGATSTFYPDFVIWRDGAVIVVDTKGGHVLHDAAARKLLRIEPPAGADEKIVVRLVSAGQWTPDVRQTTKDGYTVWGLSQLGDRRAMHCDDLKDALELVLDPDSA